MEIDSEDKADEDNAFELEEASTTIEEAQTHVAISSTDEALCQKLLNLSYPRVAAARTGVKSMFMKQMLLLGKMDTRRLMKSCKTNAIVARMNSNIVEH